MPRSPIAVSTLLLLGILGGCGEESPTGGGPIGPPPQPSGEVITVDLPGGATIDMVWIEPGTFMMGSPSSEAGRYSDEGPQHEVTITRGFYLGKYELTQAQWESVTGTRPWEGQQYVEEGPNSPAVYLSWFDARNFADALNEAEGAEIYRLPTEAEWEYACRADTTSSWSFGDEGERLGEYAWYDANAWNAGERYAHEVGGKRSNRWGLHDMHGNVWEWVSGWYGAYKADAQTDPIGPLGGSVFVARGGSFNSDARHTRSAYRSTYELSVRLDRIGVRLLRQEL